jgi:acyl-coenzyme A thioesterase PaaI-like protein
MAAAPRPSKARRISSRPCRRATPHAHRGRTTIVLETRITRSDGKLAAIVTQTQLIFDSKE